MVSAELREKARPWIEEQLRIRTDLDPTDMGEYVLTLLEYNGTRDELNERCTSELKEFLGDSAAPFVEALLNEIENLQHPQPAASAPPQVPTQAPGQFQQQAQQFQQQFQQQQFQPQGRNQNRQNRGQMSFDPTQLPNLPGMPSFAQLQSMMQMQMGGSGSGFQKNQFRGKGRPSALSSVENQLQYANRRLVVENVPEDKLNEDDLRTYFSQFGTLTRIKIDRASQLAEIEFEGHDEAVKAHKSPAPIFDNRFIKVFWRKEDPNDPQEVDINAVKRIQDQRQKEFKDKEAKRKEYQLKIQELIEARAKLLQDQEDLLKQGAQGAETANALAEKQQLTAALREQLEELKAEAAQLGLHGQTSNWRGGRGGPRGRGRGAMRGARGAFRGGRGGGFGAATLDLRPKSVLVKGVAEDKQESLLSELASSRFTDIHRKSADSVVIDFSDRRSAEFFYNSASEIPSIGAVEKTWVRGGSGAIDADMAE